MSDNTNTPESRLEDGYKAFHKDFMEKISGLVKKDIPLFKTNSVNLWDKYLSSLPEEGRWHYNCKTCKKFIETYGGLVVIDEDANIKSALWNEVGTPIFFKETVKNLREYVEAREIINVFKTDKTVIGVPMTGVWKHLNIKLLDNSICINDSRLYSAGQVMARKLEDFQYLSKSLDGYLLYTSRKAVELLESEELYRSEKILGQAKWFLEIKEITDNTKVKRKRDNLVWYAVAKAPEGFCHVKTSVIGTLLDDIESRVSFEAIKNRFNAKMNPANYMRSQVAPTINQAVQAEKIIEKLGIANSLLRRYAKVDEIPIEEFTWQSDSEFKYEEEVPKKLGIFAHLVKQKKDESLELPKTVMTWEKFSRTVLPVAKNIEVKVNNQNRLMAMVTATDIEAENILRWNNTFSWYYHGGIDGEIKRRVEEQGGRYADNEIRCSLIWESYTDLDLHCITPSGKHIFFGDKKKDGGWLDIDMNANRGTSLTPVENIRWEKNAPNGKYKFIVHNYAERNSGFNPYKVELEIGDEIFTYTGVARATCKETIFEFYYNNKEVKMVNNKGTLETLNKNDLNKSNTWNIDINNFVKVNSIIKSPNVWGDSKDKTAGEHTFFVLDKCRDLSEGKGKGFFSEMLKSELHEIRRTLDAYTSTTPIEGVEEANVCGLGYSSEGSWELILRVKTDTSTRLIKIDRFD